MKRIISLIIGLLSFLACQETAQPNNEQLSSIFDWLSKEENLIQLTIKGNLEHLFVASHTADHFHPAHITVQRGDSVQTTAIKIARRGVTRKKICDFPPIKLKFPKSYLKEVGLSSFNDYKLVTHCMEGEDNLVLKEYLTYKLFNQLTEKSFRVKLAKVTYLDDSGKVPADEHFAFIIESNKELANRLNGALLNPEKQKITRVDKEQYKKMVLFQYMIGNTDWNLSKGHNIKWIQSEHTETPTPIPYDFDYCGLVNADYAVPHPQIPINNVRERFLQFRGKNKKELLPICENFKLHKAELIAICKEFTRLDAATKADILHFLESFFIELEEEPFL